MTTQTQPLLTLDNAQIFHKVLDQVCMMATSALPETVEHITTVRDNVRKAEGAARAFGMLSLAGDLAKVGTAFTARIANDNKGQKAAFTKAVRQFAEGAKAMHGEIEKRLAKDVATESKFRGAPGGDKGDTPTVPVVIKNADGTLATATKKAPKVKAEKAPRVKKEKTLNPCHCGCGAMVPGLFKMGHDAKLKSRLLGIGRLTNETEKKNMMTTLPEVAMDLLPDFLTRWDIPYTTGHGGIVTIEAKPLKPRAPKAPKVKADAVQE